MKQIIYERTIRAAEKLFNRFGISKTAINDVAKAAEVSRASIFNHFGNKDGLLSAVLDFKIMEFAAVIRCEMDNAHSASSRLKAVLLERIKLFTELKFISDSQIAADNPAVTIFMDKLNLESMERAGSILRICGRTGAELQSILNTISFMLKGIEQSITGGLDKLPMKQIEDDIDYFLKLAVHEGSEG